MEPIQQHWSLAGHSSEHALHTAQAVLAQLTKSVSFTRLLLSSLAIYCCARPLNCFWVKSRSSCQLAAFGCSSAWRAADELGCCNHNMEACAGPGCCGCRNVKAHWACLPAAIVAVSPAAPAPAAQLAVLPEQHACPPLLYVVSRRIVGTLEGLQDAADCEAGQALLGAQAAIMPIVAGLQLLCNSTAGVFTE